MTRVQQQIGKAGEQQAESALRRIGVEMIEHIGTPVTLIPSGRNDGTYRVIFGEKVAGDRRGILPGGRSVLIEVKTIMDGNLKWSDFREHQPGMLSLHHEWGGVSLVVWVSSSGIFILRWPIAGFGPRKSITPEMAAGIEINKIA